VKSEDFNAKAQRRMAKVRKERNQRIDVDLGFAFAFLRALASLR